MNSHDMTGRDTGGIPPAPQVLTVGRIGADLYPEQSGVPVLAVTTFARSFGGTATNVAAGAARLGHRSAVLTKVGPEEFGIFVREVLAGFGVDATHVGTAEELLTPVVFCALNPPQDPPPLFYRPPIAPDLTLTSDDVPGASCATCRCCGSPEPGCRGSRRGRPSSTWRRIEVARTLMKGDGPCSTWTGARCYGRRRWTRAACFPDGTRSGSPSTATPPVPLSVAQLACADACRPSRGSMRWSPDSGSDRERGPASSAAQPDRRDDAPKGAR
jgi:hypothetical protein